MFLCLTHHDWPEDISRAKLMPSVSLSVSLTESKVYDICAISSFSQAVKQNPNSATSDKATPSRSGPVKKESIGAQYRHHPLRARRRPPKGMYLEQSDITSLSASQDAGVLTVRQLDTQLVSLKRQVDALMHFQRYFKDHQQDFCVS